MIEAPKQIDLFTGALVDRRTRQQKQDDRRREEPQQTLMFSQRDIAQFGVNPRPLFPLAPGTKLRLQIEDPRTDEEKEADLLKEAIENTIPMFVSPETNGATEQLEQQAIEFPPPRIGFRVWQRQKCVQLRLRTERVTAPEHPSLEQQTGQGKAAQEQENVRCMSLPESLPG